MLSALYDIIQMLLAGKTQSYPRATYILLKVLHANKV